MEFSFSCYVEVTFRNVWGILINILKIWESWATPIWSKRSVGLEESRSQILSPRSSIPNTGFQVTDPKPQILNPKFWIPNPSSQISSPKFSKNLVEICFGWKKMGKKKFLPKKNLGQKKFGSKKNLGQKKCRSKKIWADIFLLHESSSWVKIGLHAENQLPG